MQLKHRLHFKPDWSGLNPDLIHLIAAKFTEILDLVRFKSVCKNWRDFASIDNSRKNPPWLLKSLYPEPYSYFSFYTSSFEPITIHIPDASFDKDASSHNESPVRSSCDGYLALYDSFVSALLFINPLTKKKFYFPPLKMRWCNPIYIGEEAIVIIFNKSMDLNKNNTIGFFTPEDTIWRTIEGRYKTYGHLYHDKKCYIYTHDGSLEIRDTSTRKLVSKIRPNFATTRPKICEKIGGANYLVSLNNEIFQVYRVYDDNLPFEQCYFDVHKLESDEKGNFKWVRVLNIGDKMLFVDAVRVFGLKASDFEGYKGNCIYFVKYENVYNEWCCFLYRYDIKEDRAEKIEHLGEYGNTWFMPTLIDKL